jgi:uncharacterized protein involved in cysteine biosynthesis
MRPLAISIPLFIGISWGLYLLIVPTLGVLLAPLTGIAPIVSTLLFVVAWWVVATGLFSTILSVVAGWSFDAIARRTEELIDARPEPGQGLTTSEAVRDGFARLFASIGFTALAFVAGFCLPAIGAILVLSLQLALDTTSSAMQRRGQRLVPSAKALKRVPELPTYAIPMGILGTLPLINALMMPLYVIAGTILTADAAKQGAIPRSRPELA